MCCKYMYNQINLLCFLQANWFFNSFDAVERLAKAWTEESGSLSELAEARQDTETILV